jgi:predicted RNA-binding Zn-ribbon protein involved in translation (DUF1610 family)
VHQNVAQEAFAGKLVETANSKSQMQCKHCGNGRIFRLFREGYLQERVYPIFGYYPWKCKSCGRGMLLRLRKKSRTHLPQNAHSPVGNL